MVNSLLAEGGLVRRELSPAEVREVEPALHGDFVGGFLTESDSSGDIHKFTIGLAAACARRGADLRFGTDVYDVAAVDGGVRISSSAAARRHSTAWSSRPACAAGRSRPRSATG